jgi:hypothetical protein
VVRGMSSSAGCRLSYRFQIAGTSTYARTTYTSNRAAIDIATRFQSLRPLGGGPEKSVLGAGVFAFSDFLSDTCLLGGRWRLRSVDRFRRSNPGFFILHKFYTSFRAVAILPQCLYHHPVQVAGQGLHQPLDVQAPVAGYHRGRVQTTYGQKTWPTSSKGTLRGSDLQSGC